jgi:hypothetical protein
MEITVGFGRKLHPGHDAYEYATAEASAYIKLTEADGITFVEGDDYGELITSLQNLVVVNVCDRLELPYESVEGVIREVAPAAARLASATGGTVHPTPIPVVPEAASNATVQPVAPQPVPAPQAPQTATQPVPAGHYPPAGQIPLTGNPKTDADIADINANPQNWEDKRATKVGKQPDFVHLFEKQVSNPKFRRGAWVR